MSAVCVRLLDREELAPAAVREHPILFSGPMVRAILDRRKTQTRRILSDRNTLGNVRPSRCDLSRAWVDPGPSPAGNRGPYLHAPFLSDVDEELWERIYPRYAPGDRLWVRETHHVTNSGYTICRADYPMSALALRMDNIPKESEVRWRPSIFMERERSRLTLEITGVRVERLQEITGRDVLAEGIDNGRSNPKMGIRWENMQRMAFEAAWGAINGKRAPWAEDPWVLALEFKRLDA